MLDANLLLLLMVGISDRRLIGTHKRTRAFREQDFVLLVRLVAEYDVVLLTPNIVTECSNLLRHTSEPLKSDLTRLLGVVVRNAQSLCVQEIYVASADAAGVPQFLRLGLTDAGILSAIEDDVTLLTADLDLYLEAAKSGARAVNFHHLRSFD